MSNYSSVPTSEVAQNRLCKFDAERAGSKKQHTTTNGHYGGHMGHRLLKYPIILHKSNT